MKYFNPSYSTMRKSDLLVQLAYKKNRPSLKELEKYTRKELINFLETGELKKNKNPSNVKSLFWLVGIGTIAYLGWKFYEVNKGNLPFLKKVEDTTRQDRIDYLSTAMLTALDSGDTETYIHLKREKDILEFEQEGIL